MKAEKSVKARLMAVVLFITLAVGLIYVGVPGLATGPEVVSVISQHLSPVAKNLEYSTFRGVAITGRLSAADPDGDAVTFELAAAPKKAPSRPKRRQLRLHAEGWQEGRRQLFVYRNSIRSATAPPKPPCRSLSKAVDRYKIFRHERQRLVLFGARPG
jgi:hypothetical protein